MLLFKVRRERLVASHVARMQRGLHCSFFLFLNLSVCVSLADQSGRPTGGRCSVRDGDRDEGQQPHPAGHGLLAGPELSLCHVGKSGEENALTGN